MSILIANAFTAATNSITVTLSLWQLIFWAITLFSFGLIIAGGINGEEGNTDSPNPVFAGIGVFLIIFVVVCAIARATVF